jgi:DNA-directed RNA polymerase I, II, and III subunit RPABC1
MEEESSASVHAKEVTRLWRSWRTIHEMVQDRVRKADITDSFSLSHSGNANSFLLQGYELAEDEVKISLDRFRLEYTNDDGSPKYALIVAIDCASFSFVIANPPVLSR